MRGMPGIAVAEIVLDRPHVLAGVGQSVTAGVTQHVRVELPEPSSLAGLADDL